MRKIQTIFCGLALTVSLAASASAAAIVWGSPTDLSGVSDVSTAGILMQATTFATTQTVNTVIFTQSTIVNGTAGNFTFASFGARNGTAFSSTSTPFSSLDATYKAMLIGGIFENASFGAATLTLSNLAINQGYQVQIWSSDPRATGATRDVTLSSVGGGSVILDYNNTGIDGGVGQWVIGTFTASAASQVIDLTNSGTPAQINALQLRLIPEPSSAALLGLAGLGLILRRRR